MLSEMIEDKYVGPYRGGVNANLVVFALGCN